MLRLVLQNARGWIHTTEQETREGKHTHRVQPNLLLLAEASALFNKLWAAVWWHSAGLRPTWRKYMWCKRKSERSSYWDIAKCIQSNATYYLLGQKWNNEWPITALPSIIDTLLSYRLSAGLETIRAVNYMLNQIYSPYRVLETILAHMEQKRGVCALICCAVYHRVNIDNYSHS